MSPQMSLRDAMLTARSPYGAVRSPRLPGACCASAHLPAAQRRLMVMPFGSCQKLGRSFPYWFLVVQRLSSRLTWHDFAYVTIVQKVRSGSVTLPCLPKVTYSNGLGPYIPVTPDPSSQPRGLPQAARPCARGGSPHPRRGGVRPPRACAYSRDESVRRSGVTR